MAVDLDAIETALAKMTAGPWYAPGPDDDLTTWFAPVDNHANRTDASGLVLLRNAAPAMAAEIRTLRADLAAARLTAWLLMWQAVGIAHSEATVIEVYVDAMENRRDVCAHCQAEHDVPSGAMAAHVRECEQNPMAVELRSARLDAANARAVAVEACALLDARLNARSLADYVFHDEANERMASLRTRLASPADFAARVTAALDRLVEVAASEFPGSAKVDAARAEVDAAIGVGRG